MRRATRIICITGGLLATYIGSFYVLMVPNLPAYDSEDRPVFGNCPRFSESVRLPGPLSLYSGRANLLNYVFYPFEWIYTRGRPKTRPNQRIEPMTRSAVSLQFQSNAMDALLVMAHPDRSA